MIRTLIVDDEPLARKRIADLLAHQADVEIVGECGDGSEAIDAVRESSPELMFLDIQMPEVDGFATLSALEPAELPVIIFVSAYDDYALKAFEAHALDYLLKPFDDERFDAALSRVRHEIAKDRALSLAGKVAKLRTDMKARYAERIAIKSSGRTYFVDTADIEHIQGASVYAEIHANGQTHLARTTLERLEQSLDPEAFVRIHRSTIIAVNAVVEIRDKSHGDGVLVLESGACVRMSRRYRHHCKSRLRL